MSLVSIGLAVAAVFLSASRPSDAGPARPSPLAPQTVTVTLLAPG